MQTDTTTALAALLNGSDEQQVDSPARSASGKVRNLRQMGDDKFARLAQDMVGSTDAAGLEAVQAEAERRGYSSQPAPAPRRAVEPTTPAPSARSDRRVRNYKAMGDEKLARVAGELFNRGEAYHRSLESGSGDPEADLVLVHELISARGL